MMIFEPNDSLAQAPTLAEGTYDISGQNVDWFKIEATNPGAMSFTMTPTGGVNVNLELYNSAGQVIGTNFDANGGLGSETVTRTSTGNEIFYLKVYGAGYPSPGFTTPTYRLVVDLPNEIWPGPIQESNDTLATAKPLAEGTHQIAGRGTDWFSIATNPGATSLTMTPVTGADINMELYNSAGQVIAANFAGGQETINFTASGDTYYVKLYSAADPVNGSPYYHLNVNLADEVWPAPAYEPNDTQATARALAEGSYKISGIGDDWYSFVSNPGATTVTMTPAVGTDVNIILYNAAGQVLQSSFAIGTETLSFNGTGETYYIKVASAVGTPTAKAFYNLTIDLADSVWPDPAYEPNDTLATARVLTEGTYQISGIGDDWYTFVSNPGTGSVSMTPAVGTDVNIVLYNSAGAVIQSSFASGTETLNFTGTGETFYLKAYSTLGTPTAKSFYHLTLDLPADTWPAPAYEDNNTQANAKPLTAGTYQISGLGDDWFSFIPTPGTTTVSVTPATGTDVNLVVYDNQGRVETSSFGTGPEVVTFEATGETYYIKTFPVSNTANKSFYNLTIQMESLTWAKKLDFGPIHVGSVGLYDIDNDGKDEIFVGTSKKLDAAGNELLPAGFICLEDDGTVKWTVTFPSMAAPDPVTGKVTTTSNVTTAPLFTDLDGDGAIDIVVGVGGDESQAASVAGERGGLYALTGTGQIKWFQQSLDVFGGVDGPDGRPEGVRGSPSAFDIDSDGVREVIYNSWDHTTTILDGRTGAIERRIDFLDTIGSTPKVVDLNRDGNYEIVVAADVTKNTVFGIWETGGILHAMNAYGQQNVAGWNQQVLGSFLPRLRGFYYDQVLWSSPQTVDLDGDGSLEVIYGTGNFFEDSRGQFVDVRNADGSLRFHLPTEGRTSSAPLIADLDGDGRPEIIQATLAGNLYAWNWQGQQIFKTAVTAFGVEVGKVNSLWATPLAADLDGDNKLEIILTAGLQQVIVNSQGVQLTDTTLKERIFNSFVGTGAVRDIDGDGKIDIISGGTNTAGDQAVVYRWSNPFSNASNYRDAGYQYHQSLDNIQDFVDRFYSEILNRTADPGGENYWADTLYTGVKTGADVAQGFIFSLEYANRNTSNDDFVNTLYRAFFGRAADQGGYNMWMSALGSGASRASVLDGFIYSQEFANLCGNFGIRPVPSFGVDTGAGNNTVSGTADSDILRSGAGDDIILDQGTTQPDGSDRHNYALVYRLYGATLAREPDNGGLATWVNSMAGPNGNTPKVLAGAFVGSAEFNAKYGSTTNEQFVTLLYNNVLGRAPDPGGLQNWLGILNSETDPAKQQAKRAEVVLGFSESGEYQNNTNAKLDSYMREGLDGRWNDVIEGGAGNDIVAGGLGGDVYIFRAGYGGTDTVNGFEPWDELQFSGFGYSSAAQPLSRMSQQGANVVFADQGQTITFTNMTMGEMQRVRYNLS